MRMVCSQYTRASFETAQLQCMIFVTHRLGSRSIEIIFGLRITCAPDLHAFVRDKVRQPLRRIQSYVDCLFGVLESLR